MVEDVEWIQKTIAEAADVSTIKIKNRTDKRQMYWWNEHIAELKKRCTRDRRDWTKAKSVKKRKANKDKRTEENTEELKEKERKYRKSKKDLVQAIFKAKEDSWKALIQEIDKDPWGIPYKIVMNRLRLSGPGLTEKLEEDKLRKLINQLFPRETEINGRTEIKVGEWNEDWDVSPIEADRVVKRKGVKSTAPGIDGITTKMWRKVPNSMVNAIAGVYTKCFRVGEFPAQWKEARLVLIPKGKFEDQEIPKARPICLINDIGKGLERVIVGRIEEWIEKTRVSGFRISAIGKNQYGFMKNRSTIDALNRVKKEVKIANKEGNFVILISLDIENAFNSIPWSQIRSMMKRKRIPVYLLRLLNNYFENRSVQYVTASGTIERTEVQRGVPQGSVLGPLIWNLVYDRVLKVKKEEGCELIGYADDTLIMSIADTYEEAKHNAVIQADRTIRAIRNLGLKVAVEKTEAMLFYGKKGKRPPNDEYIDLEGKEIKIGKKLKYLGIILDSKLSFEEHFRYVREKADKVRRALCRLMPNLRGPHENKRRLYAYVIESIVMYGAPVWYDSFVKNIRIQRPLRKLHKQMAIRVISGYRTIAYEVAIVLARTPPWELVASKYKRTYDRFNRLKENNEWNQEAVKEIRKEEEDRLRKVWKKRLKDKKLPGWKIRRGIHQVFEKWMDRKHGGMNYAMTQIITGHGCFNSYLERIKKIDSALCSYCQGFIDDAEHTLKECEEWNIERDELKYTINSNVDIDNIIRAICYNEETWIAVNIFAQKVMTKKEEDERRERQMRMLI